ncbi:MAG: M1 family metallopeptidase, partial [Flavobacteriales bacterium]|nr:M1 family metallopeptidase [Flavobacteriales bacterium]
IASAQPDNYWQQKIKYEMNIDMNVDTYKYIGESKITYYNNSPDTLRKVYFHLYFNAFQPGSEMDVRQQLLPDPDRRIGDRISKLTPEEIGYQKIISIKQGRKILEYNIEGTLLEVKLQKAIMPNSKTVIYLNNEAQVPKQVRRSGRDNSEGVKLSMTQWYPKMAEYDKEGWHLDAYISREFHGVYGTFDVKINIDKAFTIGGTGVLKNPQEIGHGYEQKGKKLKVSDANKLQWHFVAKNVHDFAWGADDEYLHDVVKMNDKTDIHFLYKEGNEDRTKNWKELEVKMQDAFNFINNNFGEYPYEQFSFVQGGDGGMEYPMSTLILGNGKSVEGMVGLAVHESLHSWYQGVLG